jgi:hypothetical protein
MNEEEINPKIKDALDELQSFPPRDKTMAAHGEANFLKEADEMEATVSRKQQTGLKGWINTIIPAFQRKERLPMLKPFFAVVIAVAVLFGGTGATVYAAQGSLPEQALYPVKTWCEDALVSLASSSQLRLNYELDFSDRRITEMVGLLSAGKPVPEMVATRLQNELQQALELAAGMDDPQMLQQLEQIRLRIETQLQTVTALMAGAKGSENSSLNQTQARLREQVQLVSMGQADPQAFRMQVQQRRQDQDRSGDPTPGSGNGPQGAATKNSFGTPVPSGTSYGPGPAGSQIAGTPGQYGPGPKSPNQTPQPGNGSQGPATQNPAVTPNPTRNGDGPNGSQPTGTPGQYGPGLQPPDCTPQRGSGSGNGP